MRGVRVLEQQDQRIAVASERPVLAVQGQLELAAVGRREARAAALVVQVQTRELVQIGSLAGDGPLDAAREQPRIVRLEPVVAHHFFDELRRRSRA